MNPNPAAVGWNRHKRFHHHSSPVVQKFEEISSVTVCGGMTSSAVVKRLATRVPPYSYTLPPYDYVLRILGILPTVATFARDEN